MRGSEVLAFESSLKVIFDTIDDELEERWGDRYPLHPSRPARGRAANKEHDGLFNIGASFSAGYGTDHGRGYVVDVRMVTLARVPTEQREVIWDYVVARLEEELPRQFPDRDLDVVRDGSTFKIVGDLSLR